MSTIEDRADEILAIELPAALERRAFALFDAVPHITTLLLSLEKWLHEENDDEEGYRIVERCTIAMAEHEALTE